MKLDGRLKSRVTYYLQFNVNMLKLIFNPGRKNRVIISLMSMSVYLCTMCMCVSIFGIVAIKRWADYDAVYVL